MSRRIPWSTYRLQLTKEFGLFDAARRLPYLHELGVDWVYLSPLLTAEDDSDHGYDVRSHDSVDAARGGAEGLAALSAEARRLGMGVLVDIVPNHVGVASPTPGTWWWDVLEHGPESRFASCFDIDWDAGDGKLLLPVLGSGDEGAVEVRDDHVQYHDLRLPLAPGTSKLDEQHYALVDWRRGDAELNYRRFFTVTTLAGLRVEDPEVFDASHVEIKRWFDEGLVDGLRIDHPDGLRGPGEYLDRLAELAGDAYVVVEKILEPGEALPPTWRTAGTTGYDVLALVDRVLTDPAGEPVLGSLDPVDYPQLVHETKRAVADQSLQAEVRRICRELDPALVESVETDRLRDAVAELLACFPVYRSYLPFGAEHLDTARACAGRHRPDLAPVLDALLPVLSDPTQPAALRFQQTSGMVMAKGVEDCAFYRYSRLTSLNEVGGDPSQFSISVEDFHEAMRSRQESWPDAMTTLSTHDTKRSEDVRARIAVLAEAPEVWRDTLGLMLEAAPMSDPAFANLLWQAAYGAWPISRPRLHAYAEKAMREAGSHTSWTDPDSEFEAAVHGAVDAAYDVAHVRGALERLVGELGAAGRSNALSAKALSLTLPGVPDIYQGSELGDLSLVDPDNRRPVDFDAAQSSLTDSSNPKQTLTSRVLRLRRDRPELFTTYTPLLAEGPAADHVLAFDRGGAVTIVTRLPHGLAAKGGWDDTTLTLPDGTVRQLGDLLADGPVAVLAPEGDD